MKISMRALAIGVVVLLAGFTSLATAAPDLVDKLELRATLNAARCQVEALTFSPDGKILASTGDRNGTIQLWDTVNGRCLRTLKGHGIDPPKEGPMDVFAVAFSPDGKTLASSGNDLTVRLWDVSTGECTRVLKVQGFISSLLFSPDGKSLVLQGCLLLDLKTEKKRVILNNLLTSHPGIPQITVYDPKGELLIASILYLNDRLGGSTSLALWDSNTAKQTFTLKGHVKDVMSIAFSRDGALLASADVGKTIRLWDVATGKNVATFEDQPDLSHTLAFSPDGKMLACAGRPNSDNNREAGKVRLLRVSDGKLLGTLEGYTRPISKIVFSPNGRLLVTCGSEPTIRLWNIPSTLPEPKDR